MKENNLTHRCSSSNVDCYFRYDEWYKTWELIDPLGYELFVVNFCPFCGIKLQKIENKELTTSYQEYIKDIVSNHDHDEDAHRYKTSCYVCEAERLVGTK